MTRPRGVVPQHFHTIPTWGKKAISGSQLPLASTLDASVQAPALDIAAQYLMPRPAQVGQSPHVQFYHNNLNQALFSIHNSPLEPKHLNYLRGIYVHLPHPPSSDVQDWISTVDKASQVLNEPEVRPYSGFDKFKLLIAQINRSFFNPRHLMLYRKHEGASHILQALSHYTDLSMATLAGQLQYSPANHPVNVNYFRDLSTQAFNEYKTSYEATGTVDINLDMLASETDTIWQGGLPYLASEQYLMSQGFTPLIVHACNEVEKVFKSRYHTKNDLFAAEVQDATVGGLILAANHTFVEQEEGKQIITLTTDFYKTFAEHQLLPGLLKDIYDHHDTDPRLQQFKPVTASILFQLANGLEKGAFSVDPNIQLYEWGNNLLNMPSSSKFNPVLAFTSKFAIQLLADELGITAQHGISTPSLRVDNFSQYQNEELMKQIISTANRNPDDVRNAMRTLAQRHFRGPIDEQTFALYGQGI